jgi:hypothetical protein
MNLRISAALWEGKFSPNTDGEFEQFDTVEHGIRAGAKCLINYNKLVGLQTLRGYINRWAPANENPTEAYLTNICNGCNANPDDVYNVLDATSLAALVAAIIKQENGENIYGEDVLSAAVADALAS